jgi:hypothetical protein
MRRFCDDHFLDGTKATIARAGEFVWRDEMDLNTLLGENSKSEFLIYSKTLQLIYIHIYAQKNRDGTKECESAKGGQREDDRGGEQ